MFLLPATDYQLESYSQRPIVLPSANLAPTKPPAGVPSFIGFSRTVTTSPGLKVVLRQPRRDSEFGLPPSRLHSVLVPLSSTTTWIQMCGLVHCNSLIVPCSSSVFSSSNIAAE